MTTLIGIKTNLGEEGVIICADTQMSYYEDNEFSSKKPVQKIFYGKSWILAYAGNNRKRTAAFLKKFAYLKRPPGTEEIAAQIINTAVENYRKGSSYLEPHFKEVNNLNTLLSREDEELEDLPVFMFATNHSSLINPSSSLNQSSLSLFSVDEFGNLKESPEEHEFSYIIRGSGCEDAAKYIEDELKHSRIDENAIDIPKAIEVAVKALHNAETDALTGGPIDLIVLTASNIQSYGKRIREAIATAERESIEKIVELYKPKPAS
ncbi:MAG TPA: hypothetical protein VJI75_02630 [Candidatus Nanoarchaeia archaeon]|nr:hypothetical protein [Candidatus Nanoarchaeia archaeon]